MAIGDVPLTPIIDTVTGSVTEIGRIFLRTLSGAVNGLAPIDASYWTSRGEGILSAEVNLGALPSGYLKIATAIGIATPTTVATIPPGDVTGLAAALAGKAAVIHAPTHAAGGSDPLAVTALAGYPGGVATFLRADGTFAAPPPPATVAAHHATHEPGGTDALVGAAWLAQANVFTADQTLSKAGAAVLRVRSPTAGAANYAGLFVANDGGDLAVLQAFASTWTPSGPYLAGGVALRALGAGGLSITAEHASGAIRFSSGGTTERARIVASGELVINLATNIGNSQLMLGWSGTPGSNAIGIQNLTATTGGYFLPLFNSAAGLAGGIQQATATTVTYNTTSDARLKDDAGRAADLAALRAVVVHDFTWKADGGRDRGIFAQEAHAHYPRAITPGTDETTAAGALARPWMTDYSKFVPDLIVGWQYHDAQTAAQDTAIAALRAELADLRARLEDRRS